MLTYEKVENALCATAHALPLTEKEIDAVFLLDVVEHLERPEDCLNEIRRVLKQNGFLYLITPNGLWSRHILKRKSDPTHVHEYTWPEIKSLLEQSSFRIEQCIASGLPLIGRIDLKLSRKIARSLGKIALPFAVPSFWIIAHSLARARARCDNVH